MREEHEKYLRRCLQLAQHGASSASPNPMVGSVIVYQGKIIGEGWHQQAGKAHAEVNAIANVTNKELNRQAQQKGMHWISSPETRPFVHRERSEVDGILVGANTIINDNPHLGISEFPAQKKLWRIIIDLQRRVEPQSQVFRDQHFIYFSGAKREVETHIINTENPLPEILKILHQKDILSIMVEGGAYTLQQFIGAKLWDEALLITGPQSLNQGLAAPKLNGVISEDYYLKQDRIQRLLPL